MYLGVFIYLGCAGSQLWHLASSFRRAGSFRCSMNSQLRHACGTQFPNQGLNLGPLHWEHGLLPTGPPEKPMILLTFVLCFNKKLKKPKISVFTRYAVLLLVRFFISYCLILADYHFLQLCWNISFKMALWFFFFSWFMSVE